MNLWKGLAFVVVLVASASQSEAQHKYVFPQFAFGGGWESSLMVLPDSNTGQTRCVFSAQGRLLTMRTARDDALTGTEFILRGFNFLKTESSGDPIASSGMALLDCDREIIAAHTWFSLESDGLPVGEALVEASEEVVSGPDSYALFPTVDYRNGARFGVAVANPSNRSLTAEILAWEVTDVDTVLVGVEVSIPANSSKAFFLDELEGGASVAGRIVGVLARTAYPPSASVYAVGLRVNGPVFSTIPAIVFPRPETTPPDAGTGQADLETSVRYRVTERNSVFWRFSWILEMVNNTASRGTYDVRINFLDAQGFVVDFDLDFDVTVSARSTRTLRGEELIRSESAPSVVSVEAVVTRR